MPKSEKVNVTPNETVTVMNDRDPRLSETTRRLIQDLGKAPNARIEVIVIQKGQATSVDTGSSEDVFKPPMPTRQAPGSARRTTTRKTKTTPQAVPASGSKTVASALRELIKAGLNDDQIWPKIKQEFPNLSDNKKSYIAGQRKVLEKRQAS